jgi:hypothetical protein
MNYLDYFQVITLVIFLLVFFGRTIWLRQEGTKVFVLGSGKKGLTALLEKSFLIFFPIWLIEILLSCLTQRCDCVLNKGKPVIQLLNFYH